MSSYTKQQLGDINKLHVHVPTHLKVTNCNIATFSCVWPKQKMKLDHVIFQNKQVVHYISDQM